MNNDIDKSTNPNNIEEKNPIHNQITAFLPMNFNNKFNFINMKL
ncbi:hypothetical protein JCM31447_25580 [Fluviispira sanaruensis]|uniref:Uncharacterized protein n=1 Tax=Fluviispira sanaruensis TaxID=2493639 RepID=A0A4P2VMC2_FLUSA|nr:hypothetical protein JCM31447_25580 [Fluviispira sanaruensis]